MHSSTQFGMGSEGLLACQIRSARLRKQGILAKSDLYEIDCWLQGHVSHAAHGCDSWNSLDCFQE